MLLIRRKIRISVCYDSKLATLCNWLHTREKFFVRYDDFDNIEHFIMRC